MKKEFIVSIQGQGLCGCGCGQRTAIATKTDKRAGWVKGMPLRYIACHRGVKHTPEYVVNPETGCWEWQRYIHKHTGYGVTRFDGRTTTAHRKYYTLHRGPVPDGKELDHLCRNRCCCNPDHLEAVTRSENMRRSPLVGRHRKNRKLNAEQRAAIRASTMSAQKLAPVYGVSHETIRQARLEVVR